MAGVKFAAVVNQSDTEFPGPDVSRDQTMVVLSTRNSPGPDAPDAAAIWRSGVVVQVWWVAWPLGQTAPAVDSWYRLLDADERSRCERLGRPEDRGQYILAHGLLRLALSEVAGGPPEQWQFRPGQYGRPEVARPAQAADVRFSLSHTRGLVACAVGVGVQVGLDVEALQEGPGIHEASELFLADSERKACQSLPPAERTARLYEYWTLKEAFAKALGLGLHLPLSSAAFEWDGSGGPRVRCDHPAAGEGWRFGLGAPTENHRMATAVRGPGGRDVAVIIRPYEVPA